jgi:hypothetical protein
VKPLWKTLPGEQRQKALAVLARVIARRLAPVADGPEVTNDPT